MIQNSEQMVNLTVCKYTEFWKYRFEHWFMRKCQLMQDDIKQYFHSFHVEKIILKKGRKSKDKITREN